MKPTSCWTFSLLVVLAICHPLGTQAEVIPTEPRDMAKAAELADIPDLAKSIHRLRTQIQGLLLESGRLTDDPLKRIDARIHTTLNASAAYRKNSEADLSKLLDLDAELTLNSHEIGTLLETYQTAIRKLEALSADVAQERARWKLLESVARSRSAPTEIQRLLSTMERSLSEVEGGLQPERDRLLVLLSKAIDTRSLLDDLNSAVLLKRRAFAGELLEEDREPLFSLAGPNQARFQSAINAMALWWSSITNHLQSHALAIAIGCVAIGLLSDGLVQSGGVILKAFKDSSTITTYALRIAPKKGWISLLTICLSLNFGPSAPIAYYDLVWLIILIPVVRLGRQMAAPQQLVSLFALGLAISPSPFRTILEPMPWVDRWILNAQAGLVIAALILDWSRFHRDSLVLMSRRWDQLLMALITSLLWVGIGFNLIGKTGIARELIDGVIGTLGFLMVYRVGMEVVFLLLAGVIRTPVGRLFRVCRSDPAVLLQTLHRILTGLTALMVLWGALYAFRIETVCRDWITQFWASSLAFGNATLPVRALLTSLAILGILPFLIRFTRFMLVREILPRFRLAAGVPFAITTLSQYAVALIGFCLSMSALGIDLTQISILAGAVGVGVGFGLQNIFNNFISGLILLFERPIHVGDVIELGSLRGNVTRIGVRSSTIKTANGAEVLVPNGELIAKEVINWTLSDRRRRIEITVGVAYGTATQEVLDLLVMQASAMEEILKDPAPVAFFTAFGESSLDFVLYAWVEHYEDMVAIASRLRESINQAFKESGIVIPYPQRDVHLSPLTGGVNGT